VASTPVEKIAKNREIRVKVRAMVDLNRCEKVMYWITMTNDFCDKTFSQIQSFEILASQQDWYWVAKPYVRRSCRRLNSLGVRVGSGG
jgi:hypothetical protein